MSGPRPLRILKRAVERALGPVIYEETHIALHLLRAEPRGSVMVDVGAHVGGTLEPFARRGWRVFGFEPDPVNRAQLLLATAGNPDVCIDERAVSERDGDEVVLYTSEVSSGISGLLSFHASHRPAGKVETVRLDTFLASKDVDKVSFLKVDTEGYDLPVLRSFPWERLRPRVVICEFEDRKTKDLGYVYEDMTDYLAGLGYVVLVSEWYPVEEYGRRHRWRSVRRHPVKLRDPSGWGNLIAVEPALAGQAQRAAVVLGARLRARLLAERVAGWSRRGH